MTNGTCVKVRRDSANRITHYDIMMKPSGIITVMGSKELKSYIENGVLYIDNLTLTKNNRLRLKNTNFREDDFVDGYRFFYNLNNNSSNVLQAENILVKVIDKEGKLQWKSKSDIIIRELITDSKLSKNYVCRIGQDIYEFIHGPSNVTFICVGNDIDRYKNIIMQHYKNDIESIINSYKEQINSLKAIMDGLR